MGLLIKMYYLEDDYNKISKYQEEAKLVYYNAKYMALFQIWRVVTANLGRVDGLKSGIQIKKIEFEKMSLKLSKK